MTIVGTRPEIIKLCRVIAELERHTEHVLVHSGQNYDYELNEVFFQELGIKKPDHFLAAVGGTTAETIGNVIARSDAVMAQENPDALLLYGDTNTCLAAISAKRRKIPVFHMEAGNRCFDERVPEEINRKIIDHISDINLPLTEHARRYLLAEGLRPETVIKTGSTMKEVLEFYRPGIEKSDVLTRLGLKPRGYFVVSAHREENVDSPENLQTLLDTLTGLAETYGKPIIVSLHPRTRNRLESLGRNAGSLSPVAHDRSWTTGLSDRSSGTGVSPVEHRRDAGATALRDWSIHADSFGHDPLIRFSKPFGLFDYIKLQTQAFCVLSDSGTITEESSILNFPAVMLRQAHERPEGMDEGVLIMSGLGRQRVLQAVQVVTSQFADSPHTCRLVDDYDAVQVSKKVVRIIFSYVDYVNRTVWSKPTESAECGVRSSEFGGTPNSALRNPHFTGSSS
jgi:UDP-N-acetylglucosamine 2-epimerase (non-hydrolysing)